MSVADLMAAVYGKADAPRAPLAMVIRGALATAATKKPGYKITKTGERGGMAFTMSATH